MKPILYIFFLISFYSQSQTFKFNKLVRSFYTTEVSNKDINTNLFNTDNPNYYMRFYKNQDSLKSIIYEFKNDKVLMHYFYVKKKDLLDIVFLKSESCDRRFKYDYHFFLKRDDKIKLLINNKEDKKSFKVKLTTEKSKENYFMFFKLSGHFGISNIEYKNSPYNLVVKKAVGYSTHGIYTEYELAGIDDIDIIINIPVNESNNL